MIGIKDRFGKARIQANKVSYLARKNKRAKALYGTGIVPAATYGAEAVGYSPSMIKQLRTGSRLHGQRQIWEMPNNGHSHSQGTRVGPRGERHNETHHGMVQACTASSAGDSYQCLDKYGRTY